MATKRVSSPKRGIVPPPRNPRHPLVAGPVGAKRGRPRSVPVILSLRFRHWVAGTEYGPGAVKVTPEMADTLREHEQRAAQGEARFRDLQPLASMILPNGTVRKVDPDGFHPLSI